ncbi:MAG: YdeI/OmpD-associated family protein [Gemmatimonadaceae bacterium]
MSPESVQDFKSQQEWELWLEKNHHESPGVWLRIAKKSAAKPSVTYAAALEVALCYGWIDAQKRSESETSWLQRFMPRRPRSIWSKINREKALALVSAGRMRPTGLKEIERARDDGRWDAAYDSPSAATVPPDFEKAMKKHPAAKKFFATLNSANRYAILWRIQTAKKPETRARRIEAFIAMLEKGETLH